MDQAAYTTLQELGARIIDLCGRIHGAECQLLELIRQLDERHPWDGAMPSCAHWLVPDPGRRLTELRGASACRSRRHADAGAEPGAGVDGSGGA